ncbi:unnamed protein product, partial [Coregonus sp. 'balchen']
ECGDDQKKAGSREMDKHLDPTVAAKLTEKKTELAPALTYRSATPIPPPPCPSSIPGPDPSPPSGPAVRLWFMVQQLRSGISWDAEEICEARSKICGPNQTQEKEKDKKEKEVKEKVLEVPHISKEDDGSNRSEHSPVSTSTQLSSLSSESSSPVPLKSSKRHPIVAPNKLNLHQTFLAGPQSSPLPPRSVAPPTTTGQPLET